MQEKKPEPPGRQLDASSLQKLDGGLRHLLLMTDEEILEAVEQVKVRQEENLVQFQKLQDEVEKADSEEEMVRAQHMLRQARAALQSRSIYDYLIIDERPPVAIKAEANVQFTGNRDDLLALGLEVRSHAQDIFVVVGTPVQLATLAAQPATLRLQLPLPEEPTVEDAAEQAEIDQAHAAWPGTPAGYHGNGVIVGIIDSPLDVTHPCFRQNTGSKDTRVRYMWVQETAMLDASNLPQPATPHASQQSPHAFHNANPGTTPDFTGLTDGIVYTEADINTAFGAGGGTYGTGANQICCEPNDKEHGTHVAGIAAGDGVDRNWNTTAHIGAADQANIVYVSNSDGWNSTRIQDALRFIFAVADHLNNMPVVVNISLGGNWGPHVGNMMRDLFIDNNLNDDDGRVVVGTSGNDNHLGDSRGDGFRTRTIPDGNTDLFTMTSTNFLGHNMSLDIWYTGPELVFRLSMAGAASTLPGTFTGTGSEFHGPLGTYNVDVTRGHDTDANMRQVRIRITGARSVDPLTVELHNPVGGGDVTYYAWVCPQAQSADLTGASNDQWTLLGNSCCKSMLTVGACAKLGTPAPAAGEPITNYSGAGPTIDGRIKPEIVAVGGAAGGLITSADSTPLSDWRAGSGTSMAAPLVTGAVALLLEAAELQGYSPNHDTIKALLVRHTNQLNLHLDPAAAGYVDTDRNLYGHGRLRMVAPLTQVRPPLSIDLWVRTDDDDYGDEPFIGDCFCGAPDIRVFEAGTNNEIDELTWGTPYDVRVIVRNLGDDNAANATVRLKYTLPWAAPSEWEPAHDDGAGIGNACEVTNVAVNALDETQVNFTWKPRSGEIANPPAGQTHYCLLAVVDHADDPDPFDYITPGAPNGSTWATNIKGTNNCALRNVHIY